MSVECNTCLGSASTVVPPRIYEGLTVKVFNANYYVLATSGIDKAKYKVEKDRTFFAPDTNVFRNDLEGCESESELEG